MITDRLELVLSLISKRRVLETVMYNSSSHPDLERLAYMSVIMVFVLVLRSMPCRPNKTPPQNKTSSRQKRASQLINERSKEFQAPS